MSRPKWILIAILFSISTFAHAEPCLSDLPPSLQSTAEQGSWTILQPQDLAGRDPSIWKVNHPGLCPGVATGTFSPKAKISYLVALIQRDDQNNLTEKLILITQKKNLPIAEVVIPPAQVAAPFVVWRLARGRYAGIDGTKASIQRDSFVYEKVVGPARQFYFDGSHLKSFVISR